MSDALFKNYSGGDNKRTDPTHDPEVTAGYGRVTLNLGDRAKTIVVDSETDHIFILNKPIDLGKPAFKNTTEGKQIKAGYGIHTAASLRGERGSCAKKIDVMDGDQLSEELPKLIEIADQGGDVGLRARTLVSDLAALAVNAKPPFRDPC